MTSSRPGDLDSGRAMRAYRLLDWGTSGYAEVEIPAPGFGEALIAVAGAGLCRSDLHFIDELSPGGWPATPPWTLGHENAGRVAAMGAGAGRFREGDSVLVTGIHSCGFCEYCVRGHDNYCAHAMIGRGAGMDGGLAPYLVVPERELVALGGGDPARMAPLADAGHTAYGAVKRSLTKLRPGGSALVIGAGGLGSYAIQYLRLLSEARVVALDSRQSQLDLAQGLGAHETVLAPDATPAVLRELSRGRGFELVLDFVANESTIALALTCAAKLGLVILVGIGGGSVEFAWGTRPPLGCEVVSIIGASLAELQEVVALAESGAVRIDVERFGFEEIDLALDRLRAGSLVGRAVVLPDQPRLAADERV